MTLKTLDSALALLSCFTVQQPAWGVRALAKHSGVHPAVVHRVLATFAANGFLVQDVESGRYSLGLRLFELGQVVRKTFSPAEVVQPILRTLAEQSGETVFLSWLDGEDGLCVGIEQSQHQLRFSIELGQRFPLYAGAHAKAILAFQDEEACDHAYERGLAEDAANIPNKDVFKARLAKIREEGYAYTHGESSANVAGLALPLRGRGSTSVIGSICIAGLDTRLTPTAVPALLEPLSNAVRLLRDVVGFAA
ncbi:IclR family transcriptional regulator [Cupriavidus pauculus]|uniref:IclR family transcriptional regulator n=1 Tax=Cupriavidus pauculus TaxID=82633 RepID=UPI0007816D84|nr:IclR family transcriptional regulator [Cupriavidus pauculus]